MACWKALVFRYAGSSSPDGGCSPQGHARIVAEDLLFPNGTVITPDGQTLIVAETFGNCLTAFDIESDGSLINRRIWARLDGVFPDEVLAGPGGKIETIDVEVPGTGLP